MNNFVDTASSASALRQSVLKAVGKGRPTPFYVYDLGLLERNIREMKSSANKFFPGRNVIFHYAVKANNEKPVLAEILRADLGIDAVSIEEIRHCLSLGFKGSDISFAGVGKTDADIREALLSGVGAIIAESVEELSDIAEAARDTRLVAPVTLRINPGIDAHTHKFITTGKEENKFGIPLGMFDRACSFVAGNPFLNIKGLHFHIGSQILDTGVFTLLSRKASSLWHRAECLGLTPSLIDLGGGLGINYRDPDSEPLSRFGDWFEAIEKGLDIPPSVSLVLEPGRSLVASCGSLVSKVTRVKKGVGKNFLILDAGFNALIRPAFYNAFHKIENISSGTTETMTFDVVGPLCESSDVFAENVILPRSSKGNVILLRSAGAYGSSMASAYNLRRLNDSLFLDSGSPRPLRLND